MAGLVKVINLGRKIFPQNVAMNSHPSTAEELGTFSLKHASGSLKLKQNIACVTGPKKISHEATSKLTLITKTTETEKKYAIFQVVLPCLEQHPSLYEILDLVSGYSRQIQPPA